jgi:predicted SAM-dependent methyltransferase
MKLNLGCGNDIKKDFVNVDNRDIPGVNVKHDLSQPLPFEDNTVDYINAQDVLEHFPFRETDSRLLDWKRVLKPLGKMRIQVPNIEAALSVLQRNERHPKYHNNYDAAFEYFRALIFGGQDFPGNFHYTCFTPAILTKQLLNVGFTTVTIKLVNNNIEAEAVK